MKNAILKKVTRLCVALSLLFTTASYGQLTIVDTGNCLNHVLHASVTGTMPIGTGITGDDSYSGVFPIGFTFNFYGTNYTQLVIGSNGVLNFDLSLASAYCPWPITAALLGNPSMRNAICGPWCDILISAGGSITRTTTGVAPNRKFAVTWCGSRMYSCTAQWTTSQIIIYETSNLIEVHTAHKTICAWNSGRAITGIQNAAGTLATVPPGRDWNPSWSVTSPPEAWRFTPSGPSYTVAPITYAPLPYATSAVYWYDSTTGAYLGTGPYLTVNPTVPTTYMAAAIGCNDTTKAYIHVLPTTASSGGIPHISGTTFTHPTECGKCDGKIVLHGVNPHQVDTVFHSINGVAQPPYVDSAALDSTITLDNLCGAVYDWIYVKVGNCPSNQVGPITLVTPVLAISNTTFTHPTVCGKYDGSIKLYGLTPYKPVSVAYTKNGTPQPPSVGVVAGDSTYVISGLGSGNYTGILATVLLCTAPGVPVTLIDPPPYMPSFTLETGLGCFGDTVFVTNTTTPSGYNSYWNYTSPGGPLDSTNLYHVYNTHLNSPKYVGTYTVSLTYNTTNYHNPACELTVSQVVNFDHHLIPSFTSDRDTVCAGEKVIFTNTTSSDNTPTYVWQFGNGATDPSESPEYTYEVGSYYTVTMTATDALGCIESTTGNVEVIELAVRTNVSDTDVCLRQPMPLLAQTRFPNGNEYPVSFAWTQAPSGGNLTQYDIANPDFSGIGDYTLTVKVTTPAFEDHTEGCPVTKDIVIRSHPPVTITDLTESPVTVKLGNTLQLTSGGGVYYMWSPANGTLNNPNINNPVVKPTDSVTTYVVQVMNLWGCLASDSVVVYVDQDVDQFVPSAFTPNGDGKNDLFRIVRLGAQRLVAFRVYNRWGENIYYTIDPKTGWDGTWNGKPQDVGTYTYEIIVALPSGVNKVYKGNVTLIR